MNRVLLFLKGICMGIADVIPGVSGGTLALILGVYKELVDSIKGLNLRFVPALARWLKTRSPEHRAELAERLRELNLPFLMTLGAGIACALAVGSVIIPYVMENFPVPTRAFFFGLIVASVWVPFRMIEFAGSRSVATVVVGVVVGIGAGFVLTNPGATYESTREWFEVSSEGQTLKDLTRLGPSALASADVFWDDHNAPMRDAVRQADPAKFEELSALHAAETNLVADKAAMKARSAPYDEVEVPAGTPLKVPRPEMWFVFISGMIAICAMILPGISGSYILLILGNYFFILNALKGFLTTLAHGAVPLNQGAYVVVFCAGCAIGLLGFSRVLSYLLRERPVPTLGVLVGLMVGCLRGIWPFRATVDGIVTNVWPGSADGVVGAGGMFLVGLAIVVAFGWFGRNRSAEEQA